MKLRCKAGDLAIITKEELGCEANIGRVVRVSGPILVRVSVGPTWLIAPVGGPPWRVKRAARGGGVRVVVARTVAQLQGIEHPDLWMVPLRNDSPTRHARQATEHPDSEALKSREDHRQQSLTCPSTT